MSSDPNSPTPGSADNIPPAQDSKPSASHYMQELPLPEDLQKLLEGRYVVKRFLGQGGMGAVYEGLQMPLRRPVAIKIMRRGQGAEFDFDERFRREAYAMAALTHPHIVQVYDCGDAGENFLFISMELVEGGDLAGELKMAKMSPERALTLVRQICDALQVAHEAGIVHRDIKPANTFITRDGNAKVADFGLAKTLDAKSFMTQTGLGMGTPDYAAPEQFAGARDLDQRADIFSVGVMMYQMLTGALPRGAYRPPSKRAAIDPRLDDIVFKAMEQEREDRYQSIAELKADLEGISGSLENSAVPRVTSVPRKSSTVRSTAPSPTGVRQPTRMAPAPAPAYAPPQKKSSGMGAFVAIILVLGLAAGGWFFWQKQKADSVASQKNTATAATTDASSSGSVDAPAAATKDAPFINSLGMKFVPVPITGGPTNGQRVLFSIWATRVQDYEVFATETKCAWPKPDFEQGPAHPALMVTWDDAKEFCRWLTERERKVGRLGASELYRLARDHEWSCAVGIGEREDAAVLPAIKSNRIGDVFPWGDAWPPPAGAGNFAGEEVIPSLAHRSSNEKGNAEKGSIAGYNDGYVHTSPVGSFAANRLGLFDLGGNVFEWTEDLWTDAAQGGRVARGCAWIFSSRNRPLSSGRIYWPPTYRSSEMGFRVVLAPASGGSAGTLATGSQAAPATSSSEVLTFSGHRYQLVRENVTWDAAKAKAEAMGGHLATITSKEENDWIASRIVSSLRPDERRFFIGASRAGPRSAPWKWVTGETLAPQPWMGNFADNDDDNRAFLSLRPTGWDDLSDIYQVPFLVEWDDEGTKPSAPVVASQSAPPAVSAPSQPAASLPPLPPSAPSGSSSSLGSHRYQFVREEQGITLSQAQAKAQAMGGHLATITSKEEDDHVRKLVKDASKEGERIFLGARREQEGWGSPEWITGEPLTYLGWQEGTRQSKGSGLTLFHENGAIKWGGYQSPENSSVRQYIRGFLVEWDDDGTKAQAPPAATGPATVGGHPFEFQGHRYEIVTGPPFISQAAAKAKAETAGGHLVTITSKEENDFLQASLASIATEMKVVEAYIGAQSANSGKDWAWFTGEPFTFFGTASSYTGSSKPSGNALAIRKAANGVTWDQLPSNYMRGYIVEWDDDGTKTQAPAAAAPSAASTAMPPPAPDGTRTWTDTKGRAIQAKFVRLQGDTVILVIGGREQPVSMNTLSAGSQKLARDLEQHPGAETATKEAPFTNTLGMKFVPVPITGGPTNGQRVLFSIWETRLQDYQAFVQETNREWPKPDIEQEPTHPAVMVNWDDARAFCAWLTEKERKAGKIGADQAFRLPSDHEWSCAVGIGDKEDPAATPVSKSAQITEVFPWGTRWPPSGKSGNYASEEMRALQASGKVPGFEGVKTLQGVSDGYATTAPVGSYDANALGMFDLGGNVWEWCSDWYEEGTSRVLRGSAWFSASESFSLSSKRTYGFSQSRARNYGFRIVLAKQP